MKQAEVYVGETYLSRISGKLVVVRVTAKDEYGGFKSRSRTRYTVINLMTNRELRMSAARLRDRAEKNPETGKWRKATTPAPAYASALGSQRGTVDAFSLDNMPRADGKTPTMTRCRHCPREMHPEFIEEHERVCYLNPNRVSDSTY